MTEPRPFAPDRYSPTRVSALLRLPDSNARSFLVASALGNILDGDGTRNSLKSAKEATGVLIEKKKRDFILDQLGITTRHWRRLVRDWESRYLAHRCSPGVVVLFTKPFLVECPSCHTWFAGRGDAPTLQAKPRGRPFEKGPIMSAKGTNHVRLGGADMSAHAAQMRPSLGTNSEHPRTGVATRDEMGLREEVALESPSEGSLGNRRGRENDADPEAEA